MAAGIDERTVEGPEDKAVGRYVRQVKSVTFKRIFDRPFFGRCSLTQKSISYFRNDLSPDIHHKVMELHIHVVTTRWKASS